MKRKITAKLIEWKNNGNGRMPLLIVSLVMYIIKIQFT